jgi:hypothetical protein
LPQINIAFKREAGELFGLLGPNEPADSFLQIAAIFWLLAEWLSICDSDHGTFSLTIENPANRSQAILFL